MAYNRVNKLRMYKKIVALTKQHYDEDILNSYAKIWRLYSPSLKIYQQTDC